MTEGDGKGFQLATVVLAGQLSPKWLEPELAIGEAAAIARCAGAPKEVLAHCRRLVPCVLVVDGSFVEQVDSDEFYDAVDFGQAIRVLVELDDAGSSDTEHLLRIGCAGYLGKDASATRARCALRAVLAGELWAGRDTTSSLLRSLLRKARHRLTFRESEILALVSEGLKNSEIATRLFISPQTVRWHLRSLYSKLGTHDRGRAAVRPAAAAMHAGAFRQRRSNTHASDAPSPRQAR